MDNKGLAKSIEPFFEKVEKLSKIQRILISTGFFALLAGVFIYFLFWPKLEKINSLAADLKELEKKQVEVTKSVTGLEKEKFKLEAKLRELELSRTKQRKLKDDFNNISPQ